MMDKEGYKEKKLNNIRNNFEILPNVNIDVKSSHKVKMLIFEILSKKDRATLGEIIRCAKNIGYSEGQVKYALISMLSDGTIFMPEKNLFSIHKKGKNVFKIYVERVYRGGATVVVNSRFRARVEEGDSCAVLKKGQRLIVRGSLVKNGVTRLKIYDIIAYE